MVIVLFSTERRYPRDVLWAEERLRELYGLKLNTLAQLQAFRKAVLRAGVPDNLSLIPARQVALPLS